MERLIFGNGNVGVHTKVTRTKAVVILNELAEGYKTGDGFSEGDAVPVIELVFNTKEGLGVLIKALEACHKRFIIPDELRMGT